MESPNMFVDEMVTGAFRSFKHIHKFEETDGITHMTDIFDFQSPLGFLGKIANHLFVTQHMTGLLEQRNSVIKEYAESDKWRMFLS